MSSVMSRVSTSRDKGKLYSHFIQGPKFDIPMEHTCLGLLFFNYAVKYKESICQISATENKTETYESVRIRTVRLALDMEKKGVTYKDVIAVCSDNNMDNVIPIIAAMYIGAKVVNIDHTFNSRQIKQVLTLISPTIIFVEEATFHIIKDTMKETNLKTEIIVLGGFLRPYKDEITYTPTKVDVHETAILFFSSGSSGVIKAACHSHYSLMRIVQTVFNCGLYSRKVLHFTTFCWITFILILIGSFVNGSTRIFGRAVKDGAQVLKYVEQFQVTTMFMTPMSSYCLTHISITRNVASLEHIILTGSVLSSRQLKLLNEQFPNVCIIFNYGLTEVGLVTSFNPKSDADLIRIKIGSCGKIVPEAKIKIVDIDSEESLIHNHMGEIRIKSPGLMKGYHSLDCAEFFDSEGFLKSGDIGYYDGDKCFYVVDNVKEVFRCQGHLIVPSKIEDVLLEHPAVKDAGVFGYPSKDGPGEVPAACVVLKEKSYISEYELEKFSSHRLQPQEQLKGGIKYVSTLPKTPMGRCIRRELKSLFTDVRHESESTLLTDTTML